jgi:ring-1,2-phenylacetyl-CoA epoxidase subunit PaaD
MVIDNLVSDVLLPMGPLELPQLDNDVAGIWRLLESVCDPEIPVLSLREIGVLRAVKAAPAGWQLWITPTYNGCPAMSQMKNDLLSAMQQAGKQAEVLTCLAPAWSSDWITESAKEKLRVYGIAPPHSNAVPNATNPIRLAGKMTRVQVACPQCESLDTTEISQFGSTACKAMYKCLACAEPFDYFKPY